MRIRVWRDTSDEVWEWRYRVGYRGEEFAGKAGSREMAWTYVSNVVLMLTVKKWSWI